MTAQSEHLEQALLVNRTHAALTLALDDALGTLHGLSWGDFVLLRNLAAAGSGVTLAELVVPLGVPASAVGVDVAGQSLTLSVTTEQMSWQRSIRLGGRLDPDKVEASHVDGRLTVRIGTVDEPTARKVEIATTPLPQLATPAEPASSIG